jgi:hypothetical protein
MIKFLIRSEISNGDKKRTSALIIFQNKSLKDSYYSPQEKRQCLCTADQLDRKFFFGSEYRM